MYNRPDIPNALVIFVQRLLTFMPAVSVSVRILASLHGDGQRVLTVQTDSVKSARADLEGPATSDGASQTRASRRSRH